MTANTQQIDQELQDGTWKLLLEVMSLGERYGLNSDKLTPYHTSILALIKSDRENNRVATEERLEHYWNKKLEEERATTKELFDALGIRFGASAGSAIGCTVRNHFGEEFDFQLDRDAVRALLAHLSKEKQS